MVMQDISISEFKAKCLGLIEQLQKSSSTAAHHAPREAGC